MSIPTLMKSAVPLSPERHGQSFVQPSSGYGFASDISLAPVLVREFGDLVGEYPIAFVVGDEGPRAVALLGLADNENLFLNAAGDWDARYVPAMLRQYPFMAILDRDKGRGILAIAEDYQGLNTSGMGMSLFESDGSPGELVRNAQNFVTEVTQNALKTESFCTELAKRDLLSPIKAELKNPAGMTRRISGLHTVDRQKLAALSADDLRDMMASGAMEAIYLHLSSLRNLRRLAERISADATADIVN